MNHSGKLGIAFSGGGLQGISHIGVIRALEELQIHPDVISGTSSGSIFASMYAMGYTSSEMEEIAKKSWKKLSKIKKSTILKMGFDFLFRNRISREGVIDGKIVENVVTDFAAPKQVKQLSDLTIPTALCTVDTYTTDQCIFLSQKIPTPREHVHYLYDAPIEIAVRSSMAFPGIYNSCDYQNYNFIDGGTKENLPVEVLKDLGMDRVIAISFAYKTYHPNRGIINLFLRVLDIFPSDRLRSSKHLADYVISIVDDDTALLEIEDFSATIQKGYDAVMNQKDSLLAFLQKQPQA